MNKEIQNNDNTTDPCEYCVCYFDRCQIALRTFRGQLPGVKKASW